MKIEFTNTKDGLRIFATDVISNNQKELLKSIILKSKPIEFICNLPDSNILTNQTFLRGIANLFDRKDFKTKPKVGVKQNGGAVSLPFKSKHLTSL